MQLQECGEFALEAEPFPADSKGFESNVETFLYLSRTRDLLHKLDSLRDPDLQADEAPLHAPCPTDLDEVPRADEVDPSNGGAHVRRGEGT